MIVTPTYEPLSTEEKERIGELARYGIYTQWAGGSSLPPAYYLPIIVFTIGRSGSSTVARILHERCGVSMGEIMNPATKDNPGGTYEDVHFHAMTSALFRGGVTPSHFCDGFTRHARYRMSTGKPWGFKTPPLWYSLPYVLNTFGDLSESIPFIICTRDDEKVIQSSMRYHNVPREQATAAHLNAKWFFDFMRTSIEETNPTLVLDFTERLDEDWLYEIIQSFIDETEEFRFINTEEQHESESTGS